MGMQVRPSWVLVLACTIVFYQLGIIICKAVADIQLRVTHPQEPWVGKTFDDINEYNRYWYETFPKWIPKHPKTNAWISTSQIAQEGDKVLLKSSQGEIFEVEPEVLKPNHSDVHILIRRVGESKILEMENVGVEMCWRCSCLYDYMDYIYMIILYMYVQYTYLPWLADVFSWTKSRGQTGFGFNGSNSICHLLRKVACMSTLVRNMVDDSGTDEEIPLPNASSSIVGNQKCLVFVMVTNRDLSAQICWFWGQDRNPEQGGDRCIQKDRERIALLGIWMQLSNVSIHVKIWDCPYHSIWGHWLLQVPQGLLAACDAPRYVNILF